MKLLLVVASESRPAFEAAASGLHGVELTWVVYEREDEIREHVRRHLAGAGVEGVVLGPMPLDRCRSLLPPAVTVGVVRVGATDLALAFARSAAQGVRLHPVSIDTFAPDVVEEVTRELAIPATVVDCLPYSPAIPVAAIVAFHREFRRLHPDAVAISGRSEVARLLRREMTVLNPMAAPSTLRTVLGETILRMQSRRAGDQSLGAAVFRIAANHACDLDRARVALRHLLMNRPDLADAWIEDRGDSAVVVFAHRALLLRVTKRWELVPFIDEAQGVLGLPVAAGFGLGPSARTSVRYAEQAVARAVEDGAGCGYLLGEGGVIIGPMGRSGRLAFTYREHPERLEALARATGLSPMTLSRLVAAEGRLGSRPITPSELAAALGVTDPSGRRLMRTLTAHDLARQVGRSQSSRRGRPAQLFRLAVAADRAEEAPPTAEAS